MANSTFDLFNKEAISENLQQLNSAVKKHLHDGVSFVKDEFLDMYEKAGTCLNKMVLPVNNFLKDLSEIEDELVRELHRDNSQGLVPQATLISFDQHYSGYMEENY